MPVVPYDHGPWTGEVAECLERPLGFPFLIQRDADDHEHKADQDHRFFYIADCEVERTACHQQQKHGFLHDIEGDPEDVSLF